MRAAGMDDVVKLGGKRERILTIPRGVQLDLFPFKHRYRSDQRFVVITTRALVKPYELDLVIKTLAQLRDRIPGIRLRLIGDGPHRSQLEVLARDLGVASLVEFRGKIAYEKLHNELEDADLYISPVPVDGVSSSLLEAMASGLPPVITDILANRIWAKYGCNLTFFEPRSVEGLAHGILKYYNNYNRRISTLIENRKIIEKQACWKKNMNIIEKALMDLVSDRG